MRKVLFIIPGDINLPTGGYRYDKAILEEWEKVGVDYELISLEGNYPFPTEAEKASAMMQVNKLLEASVAVIDGLAGGALPDFIEVLSSKMPVISLLHHPLCLETGLAENAAKTLEERERKGLQHVSHVITTSPETRRIVHRLFDFPLERISSVLPGVRRDAPSLGSGGTRKNFLCVGSMIERKGHIILIEALAKLKHLDWHLNCIGATDFDEELTQRVKSLIIQHGLSDRITIHGAVSNELLRDAYLNADLFVLPSLYEGYGMVYAEAIVRGLPVIGTTAGAIPDTVPETCGILVEPGNAHALATALEEILSNSVLLSKYRQGAIDAEPSFPTWEKSADAFCRVLETIT